MMPTLWPVPQYGLMHHGKPGRINPSFIFGVLHRRVTNCYTKWSNRRLLRREQHLHWVWSSDAGADGIFCAAPQIDRSWHMEDWRHGAMGDTMPWCGLKRSADGDFISSRFHHWQPATLSTFVAGCPGAVCLCMMLILFGNDVWCCRVSLRWGGPFLAEFRRWSRVHWVQSSAFSQASRMAPVCWYSPVASGLEAVKGVQRRPLKPLPCPQIGCAS